MLPPKDAYLPFSNLHTIVAEANLLAHNNMSQNYYFSKISFQSAAVNCCFFNNLTALGVAFILLAMAPYVLNEINNKPFPIICNFSPEY